MHHLWDQYATEHTPDLYWSEMFPAAFQCPECCCSITAGTEKSKRSVLRRQIQNMAKGFVCKQCGEQQTVVTLQGIYRERRGRLNPVPDGAVLQTASASNHSCCSCFLAAGTHRLRRSLHTSFFACMCDPCITLPGMSEETSAAQSQKILHS